MKSIFKGKHLTKVYQFNNYSSYSVNKIPYVTIVKEVSSYETILETDLDTPPLNYGDQFYLTKEDKIVKIEKTLRGTDNVMVYLTDEVLSEKEELVESLKVAKEQSDKYIIEKVISDENYRQREIKDDYRREYRDAFFVKRWFMVKPE